MNRRQHLGKAGEQLAARHLESNGYSIIQKNFRSKSGEIDLVAERDGVLVFVEVRTRSSTAFGSPEESITESKKRHLIATAYDYLEARQALDNDWRIDLVAVEMDSRGTPIRVDVIENAIEY